MSQNLTDDANIKFEKLCEIVADIEKNGQNGDKFAQQTVLSAVVASDNDILWEKIENALSEIDKSELMRTVVVGLLMQKDKFKAICQYAELTLFGVVVLDEEFEDKESILLLADALTKATHHEDEQVRAKSINPLIQLYKASCHSKSTALIADTLLQRFLSLLAVRNELVDSKLFELIKSKDTEINSRVIAIEILGRSHSEKLIELSFEIIKDLDAFTSNATEKVYFLDVITKFAYSAAVTKIEGDILSLTKALKALNMPQLCDEAILGNVGDIEQYNVMHKRIAKRILHIAELIDSSH